MGCESVTLLEHEGEQVHFRDVLVRCIFTFNLGLYSATFRACTIAPIWFFQRKAYLSSQEGTLVI